MRITNDGSYRYCRWQSSSGTHLPGTIRDVMPIDWFRDSLSPVRQALLQGEKISGCSDCHTMEQHHKVSGRQRQLLKIGVTTQDFEKSMLSSPWYKDLRHSADHQGHTDQWPQDWQIDLGNYCNSACVFCVPEYSSRLAAEQQRLGLIKDLGPRSWCDDPALIDKFFNQLQQTPNLRYLHFIGGETLITPAFASILQKLIQSGQHYNVSIGFTTNLTVWRQDIVDMLCQFKEVNLGMSMECAHPLNDYVRYGGKLSTTLRLLDKWIDVGRANQWLMQLRSTPTVLSIWHLDTLYTLAIDRKIPVESCNFLDRPEFMRPSVLPLQLRHQVIQRLENLITGDNTSAPVVNTRSSEFLFQTIQQDIKSYVSYLTDQPDESHRSAALVQYLQRLENNRKNRILDYLPEYEEFLRTAGYQR